MVEGAASDKNESIVTSWRISQCARLSWHLPLLSALQCLQAPASAAVPANPVDTSAPVQQSEPNGNMQLAQRLYCHRNGVFLHWGPCAHDRWRYGYRPYRPMYRPYRPVYRYYRPYRPVYRYRRW